jgi:hypothetical protein
MPVAPDATGFNRGPQMKKLMLAALLAIFLGVPLVGTANANTFTFTYAPEEKALSMTVRMAAATPR